MTDFETEDSETRGPVELSANNLEEREIDALVRTFISPDESDSGLTPEQYAAKERTTRKAIASGSLRIIYDEASDTKMLMSSQDWRNLKSK